MIGNISPLPGFDRGLAAAARTPLLQFWLGLILFFLGIGIHYWWKFFSTSSSRLRRSFGSWFLILLCGQLGIILLRQPLTGFPHALGNLPASVVSPSLNLQPVATIILGIPLLNEIPSAVQALGRLLILGGVYVINYAHQQRKSDLSQMGSIILLTQHPKDCPDQPEVVMLHIDLK